MTTLNFHSVFKVLEKDIDGKVQPLVEKLLGDLEAGLADLGFSHVESSITSDAGQKIVVPKPAEPAPVAEPPVAIPVTDATPPLTSEATVVTTPVPDDEPPAEDDNPTTDTPPSPLG